MHFRSHLFLSGVGFYGPINVFTSPAKDRQALITVQRGPVLGEQHLVAGRAEGGGGGELGLFCRDPREASPHCL